MAVKKGDRIKIEFIGTLEDGTIFDCSDDHDEPLSFDVGAPPRQVIKGLDDALIGMELDEEKEFRVEASEAYGEYFQELLRNLPRSQLPEGEEPKVGMVLVIHSQNGQKNHAIITEVTTEFITIDLNHPLAGQALNFKIKLLEIISK